MYDHQSIEKKWQEYWEQNKTFQCDASDYSKPKYYALDMFPYPSGVGLHAGHPEGYTATDIVCRMKRMQGFNVLHPMGFDSFGLPAEQYAIQTGHHPEKFTAENIRTFRKQLKMLGFSYDWDREVVTSDPSFYHWTQWIFKQLFEDGLAKCVEMPVNWCEELGTVLANDEVIDGKSERGGYPVVRRNMRQWVIDIVAYADKLLEGLDHVDWPESTKEMQRNWIGKSVGALVDFKVDGTNAKFTVFTTRCDTLYGATYCVLAPEHDLVLKITAPEQMEAVKAYQKECAAKSDIERTELNKEKTGVFTGAYAIDPVNDRRIPIWISDYVLSTYGTGAIMAVPAHDERDYAFAKKFGLEIIPVLEGGDVSREAYVMDGKHINSGFLNGMGKQEAIDAMIAWLEERGLGQKKVNYRIREWIFARQRYWGEPIPIVHMDDGRTVVLRDDELPLLLPEIDDYRPGRNGASPLEKAEDWVNVTRDGQHGRRETSTMPGSAGSSWYFLRYIDPHNEKQFADYELMKHWMPVDLYVGGPEHAVGHLLYARMWTHFLYDKGLCPVEEPFAKLVHQGMILGANGIKMGKRFPKYVVDPNVVVNSYGADTLRAYEMFMGPLQASKPWSEQGVDGTRKWLERVWRLATDPEKVVSEPTPELDYSYHFLVKKVTEDITSLDFNTAISQMMIFINDCYKNGKVSRDMMVGFNRMFSCFCPHVGEEINQILTGSGRTIAYDPWPSYDESKLAQQKVTIIVQVNGKVRGRFEAAKGSEQEALIAEAVAVDTVKPHLEGKTIVKQIVVPDKIVNLVVR